jgi:hypothetical protein
MRKATRFLLRYRPNAKHILVEKVVVEGAKENHCYQNAVKLANTNEADLMVVSGWLVGDFFGERGTAIIPHYFVFNAKTKKYYDPTPSNKNEKQTFDYVEDVEIILNANKNSILPLSLKITAEGLVKARSSDGTHYIDLDKIEVAELYELRKD